MFLRNLNILIPPVLETLLEYHHSRRWVAFYWSVAQDELCFNDGIVTGIGDWAAWLMLMEHPKIAPKLVTYQLGKFRETVQHWLVLDRQERGLSIGLAETVHQFLTWEAQISSCNRLKEGPQDYPSINHSCRQPSLCFSLTTHQGASWIKQRAELLQAVRNGLDN